MLRSERRRSDAITQASTKEMARATTSATMPGNRLATFVITFIIESLSACWIWIHILEVLRH